MRRSAISTGLQSGRPAPEDVTVVSTPNGTPVCSSPAGYHGLLAGRKAFYKERS
jgi:hypothetical protein